MCECLYRIAVRLAQMSLIMSLNGYVFHVTPTFCSHPPLIFGVLPEFVDPVVVWWM